jgi:hypothetical protein
MRMLLRATMPHESFNALVKKGTAGKVLEQILGEIKPEAAYFTLDNGSRSLLMVVNVANPGDYVKYAEPFFLKLNADISYEIVMSPEELKGAGLEEIGKRYA